MENESALARSYANAFHFGVFGEANSIFTDRKRFQLSQASNK